MAAPLDDRERIVHLLDRLTPGATPALVAEVQAQGLEAWLEAQLAGDLPEPPALTSRLERCEALGLDAREVVARYGERPGRDATPEERRDARREARTPGREALDWVLLRAVYGANHVRETLCDFFRNHFAVSVDKGPEAMLLLLSWERDVITRHALGRFGDLLEATAHHPAMLLFLDNHLSRRPATPEELAAVERRARRRSGSAERAQEVVGLAAQRGLNENYARELLELHTLGVDRGYTQDDVLEVARCLTGWTIDRRDDRGAFRFEPGMHCEGEKLVLGRRIAFPDEPRREGEEVLRLLRAHPGTARFLALKLCRFLVRDDPDDALVERVARAFREADGDVRRVVRAVVADPAFFDRSAWRAKLRRPWELVVAALRATGAQVSDPAGVHRALTTLSEPLYRCADPTGYHDVAEAWCDPGAMAARWAFVSALALGQLPGVTVPPALYLGLSRDPRSWREELARRLLPAGLGPETSRRIDRLVDERLAADRGVTSPARLGPWITAAILGAPEFQRQ